ncbi:hypothetical protein RI367_003764 [Sorochytrium milnesiophthora]
MPECNVRGVSVSFPVAPYPCQEVFMDRLIEALQSKENALLESPTGTGKTLCLLCGVLAWRETYIAAQQLMRGADGADDKHRAKIVSSDVAKQLLPAAIGDSPNEDWAQDPPHIFYASRTHSQLSQAIKELKRSGYKVNTSVLGSREQLCINPDVQKVTSNAARASICRQKMSQRSCSFGVNVEQAKRDGIFRADHAIMDIEEIAALGQEKKACPYYLSREQLSRADVTFLPYNYLIDAVSREGQKLLLKNSIIIFDEAHNLEPSCGDATSFDLTSDILSECVEEARFCLSTAKANPVAACGNGKSPRPQELDRLRLMLQKLQLRFEEVVLSGSNAESVLPGKYIYELFEGSMGVTHQTSGDFKALIESALGLLVTERPKNAGRYALGKLQEAVNILYRNEHLSDMSAWQRQLMYYKVHITTETATAKGGMNTYLVRRERKSSAKVLNFWCFNAGITMQELVRQGVRSVILASGTLSPLESFATEMQIPFKHRLENPHVIHSTQAFVGVVPRGPSGVALNASYSTRTDRNYKIDLGNTIVNFAKAIPGGLLVFFPSYSVMNDCFNTWKEPQRHQRATAVLWDRLAAEKSPIVEPKDKAELPAVMETFYKLTDDKTSRKGAILFAVCRGKISEGIDFSDARGRAVIVTGIPFPAAKDPKITLKKAFLDDMKAAGGTLSGQEWYKQQAARAVNQAIGRVIRHRDDFGAILLCDERFNQPQIRSQLSLWVRPLVQNYSTFNDALAGLNSFFEQNEGNTVRRPSFTKPTGRVIKHIVPDRSSVPDAILKRSTSTVSLMGKYQASQMLDTVTSTVPPPLRTDGIKRPLSLFETLHSQQTAVTDGRMRPAKVARTASLPTSSSSTQLTQDQRRQERERFLQTFRSLVDAATYERFRALIVAWKNRELANLETQFVPQVIDVLSYSGRVDIMKGFASMMMPCDQAMYLAHVERFGTSITSLRKSCPLPECNIRFTRSHLQKLYFF